MLFIVAACGSPQPSPAASNPLPTVAAAQPATPTAVPIATSTVVPTETPAPTSTVVPTSEPTSNNPAASATAPANTPTTVPPSPTPSATPVPPTATPVPPTPTPEPPPNVVLQIQDGTVARYIVQEQLAALDFPNDAVGETSVVSGAIVFRQDGEVIPEQSTIVVGLFALVSDSDTRDEFLMENSLETNEFPNTTLAIQEVRGLQWPLPSQGEVSFQLIGDMTVRDVTRSVTWDVTAQFDGDSVTGKAMTEFTFEDFDMKKPRVFLLISVDDEIRLEMDFLASIGEG